MSAREATHPIRVPTRTEIPSDAPPSADSGDIRIGRRGLTIKWKTCLALVALLGGGAITGSGVYSIATNSTVDAKIKKHAVTSTAQVTDIARRLEVDHQTLGDHTRTIEAIDIKVTEGFAVLYGQVSRDEARRITSQIKDRTERERTYDRVVDTNLRRLTHGKSPCPTVTCE